MKRRTLIKGMAASLPSLWLSQTLGNDLLQTAYLGEPIAKGPFNPTWESLQNYKTPDWFRDAKFGMWAHWGPQCEPEAGDWYARGMYQEGSRQYKIHLQKYGHPSKFGFKDVINVWKADHGELRAVINGKILDEDQRKAMVWDIERGQANEIQPLPWQTDTCIGGWHYERGIYERNGYKTAKTIIQTLVDIVSKNGNLMLNIPVRGNGTIDEKERKIVEETGAWMNANGESIYGTRPWKIFGEGPAQQAAAQLSAQGFNEGKGKPFTHEDVRFATKGDVLYATALGRPENDKLMIKSLAKNSRYFQQEIQKVEWVPTKQSLVFERNENGLIVYLPGSPSDELNYANVIKVLS